MTQAVGTSTTMAREVYMNEKYDQKADIYSLGAMLLKMLTNRYPCEFTGNPSTNYYP